MNESMDGSWIDGCIMTISLDLNIGLYETNQKPNFGIKYIFQSTFFCLSLILRNRKLLLKVKESMKMKLVVIHS